MRQSLSEVLVEAETYEGIEFCSSPSATTMVTAAADEPAVLEVAEADRSEMTTAVGRLSVALDLVLVPEVPVVLR